ncbi:hypothetical protein [Cohnella terricola]|uniref:Uncharacterized protein n=1 Tax=Cohnella terricola TaxID=1289167 RepID=A0A559JTX8_9BACL|nr:hypothetical protein [Cohnella terricola]TVY03336.1 hypothetical protein FPZ45_05535 [Cohnella terricola]
MLFQFTWITILLESIRKCEWPTRQEWTAVVGIAAGRGLLHGFLGTASLRALWRPKAGYGSLSPQRKKVSRNFEAS